MAKYYILIILLFSQVSLIAQTGEDIIQKHWEAVGGKQNWENIQTMVVQNETTLHTAMQGLEKTITTKYQKRPNLYRYDSKQGTLYVSESSKRFNGKTLKSSRNHEKPKVHSGSISLSNFLIGNMLINYKEYDILYKGIEKINSIDYHVFIRNTKIASTEFYINTQTFLLDFFIEKLYTKELSEGLPKHEGDVYEVKSYYENYQEVKGVKIPFLCKTILEGDDKFSITEVKKIEINIPLEDSIFEFEE